MPVPALHFRGDCRLKHRRPSALLRALPFLIIALLVTAAARGQESSALSPILVEPYDGKEVVDERIVWSWFMQSQASDGQEILCDLVVVEVIEGQSVEEAMRLNPPVVLRANLTSATWQTSPFARELEHGRRYAWQVVAKVRENGVGAMRVVSRSELWQFTYLDPMREGSNDASDTLHDPATGLPNESVGDSAAGDESSVESLDVPAPIAISGSARHTFASENRRGTLSTAPVRFDRLQIDPTIALFGVPLELSLLLTTEQNLRQSDISRGALGTRDMRRGIGLALQQRIDQEIGALERQLDSASVDSLRAFVASDSAAIAQRIAELERLSDAREPDGSLEALERLNMLTPEQATLARFPSFGFGKVAPSFGSLLFDRVTINGGSFEFNPGELYVAAAAGKLQREVDPTVLTTEALSADSLLLVDPSIGAVEFHRNLYSLRLGLGRRHGSYVALTGLYADDDDQSRTLQTIANRPLVRFVERIDSVGEIVGIDTVLESNRVIGRQRNYGFGGVGRLELEEQGLEVDGEFNLAWFDDEANRASQMLVPQPQGLPSFLRADSMLTDFDFALRAEWQLPTPDAGSINAGIRYVGGGFRSVGVAGLRTDVLRADARYGVDLFERQARVGLRYSFEEAGYKDSSNTSRIDALGASLELRPKGLPALVIGYQRHGQDLVTGKLDTAALRHVDNTIEEVTAALSWLRQWGSLRWFSLATAMVRDGTSAGDGDRFQPDSAGVFRSRTLQLDNRVALGPQLTIGLRTSYSGTLNHPLRIEEDSLGGRTLVVSKEEIDLYNLDISALVMPLDGWSLTVGAVTTYQNEIPQPAVLGAYMSSRLDVGAIGTIELRFDYRESAVPDFERIFPVERVGRIVTTARF